MTLFLSAIISGAALGLLLALLGFGVVVLYKATGVANFAQGTFATLGAFVVFKLWQHYGGNLPVLLTVSIPLAFGAGVLAYWFFIRPMDDAGRLNLTIRTLALQMLILALIERYWAAGQPFSFPPVFRPGVALTVASTAVSWTTLGIVGTSLLLILGAVFLFRRTDVGLMFIALSERADIARTLGVPVRRLSAAAWGITAAIALLVGVLLAPTALLSSDMMEPYMLLAFTSVVLGGLTSLSGVFVGGIIVGIVNNLMTLYADGDVAVVAIFAVLLAVFRFRPQGLFGMAEIERL